MSTWFRHCWARPELTWHDVAATLAESFSEVHPLPGRDLMPVVDGAPPDESRAVYLMTRDNVLEGDTGASALVPSIRSRRQSACAASH